MSKASFRVLSLAWVLIIIIASFLPKRNIPEITLIWSPDKLVHLFIYAVLAILIALSIQTKRGNSIWKYFLIIIICAVFGSIIEILQPILTDRHFETYDILANIVGAIVGTIVFLGRRNFENLFLNKAKT